MADNLRNSAELWQLGVLIIRRYRDGWMIAIDTNLMKQDKQIPHKWTVDSQILRCSKASLEFITATAGRLDVTEIIVGEVRWYISENQDVTDYEKIVKDIEAEVRKRIEVLGIFRNREEEEITGSVVVVDCRQTELLTITVLKEKGEKDYKFLYAIKECEVLGFAAKLVESHVDKMSDLDDKETAKEAILMAMKYAAKEDGKTGGHCMVFAGGEDVKWDYIANEDLSDCSSSTSRSRTR